ncbi:MAG: thioredoxin domain-containing protein, partial [Acidimicrobiales bacterium]|nr:thioredoxin domain-containing protein [Acidimicrobiales bacterium]
MNRLSGEASPYLRQHAANPVDWYPWGPEAFDLARRRDGPIFLSIGYSACHWCHVMAHESFEDAEIAKALNDGFVSIKVDREERPDVDAVYMEAVLALTGSGGWPMSVFLTPDARPFYGGTYFPPVDRGGLPAFGRVLGALADAWGQRRPEVEEQADQLARAIAERSTLRRPAVGPEVPPEPRGPAAVDRAAEELVARLDERWGGFGGAPKFPQPALCDLLLGRALSGPTEEERDRAARAARLTLDGMAAGGIHDHLGGGFSRYSTDVRWLVPHFEKMLYDQAGLLRTYLHGWQVTGKEDDRRVVERVVAYVERDLTLAEGGICSAEDADSEGEEGRFYVWTPDEVRSTVAAGG